MKIRGGCASDIGSVRSVNQDAVCCRLFHKRKESIALCAVCDGVGGLEHGEMSSSLLVESMDEWFGELMSWLDISKTDPEVLFSHLKDAAESWNDAICRLCQEQNLKTGSTMSLLLLVQQRYYIVHVGDSRIYRYRRGILEQLTMDDSVTRLKTGQMKSYLNNYMGKQDQLWFQALEGDIEKEDIFMLCSDGLYHHLIQSDIEALCGKHRRKDLNRFCADMIQSMIERGEKDNISVCVAIAE